MVASEDPDEVDQAITEGVQTAEGTLPISNKAQAKDFIKEKEPEVESAFCPDHHPVPCHLHSSESQCCF